MENSTNTTRSELDPLSESTAQERHTMISISKQMPLELNAHWFVVSRRWFRAWEAAVMGTPNKEFPDVTEKTLGPVDNSDILQAGTTDMLPDLVEGYDIEFVPEDAWNNFVKWYGQPPVVFKREVIAWPTASGMPETRIEVYQPSFHAFILVHSDGTPISVATFTISSNASISKLAARAASSLGISDSEAFRVWNMPPRTPQSGIKLTHIYRYTLLPVSLDSDAPLTELNRLSRVLAVEVRSNGQWLLDADSVAIPSDPSTSVRFEDDVAKPIQGIPFKGRATRAPVPRGTMGLQNLGHTCFMNAGLQCLLHIPELEHYFLNDLYQSELNPNNPLSMQGEFAKAFSILVKHVYPVEAKPDTSGGSAGADDNLRIARSNLYSAYVPLHLKGTVCQWAPQLAGYEECDSQELIGVVLDGLHEDLNRVLKKPYVEKPEWPDNIQEQNITEIEARIARETWEGHARRNDSIIADLFQGMYKSTLTCPNCGKISVTFDPFMSLALPLPDTEPLWKHTVHFVSWDVQQPITVIQVELPKDSTMEQLKEELATRLGTKQGNLLVTEVWKHKFFKFFDNQTSVSDLTGHETLAVYELPIPAVTPGVGSDLASLNPSTTQSESPLIVPVLHMSSSTFGLPFFIVANSSNTESYRDLKNLVWERYKQWVPVGDAVQDEASPDKFFELHIFSSGGHTMETGFRLGLPGTGLVDLTTREHESNGKSLVKSTEALVCSWQSGVAERVFSHAQFAFGHSDATIAGAANRLPGSQSQSGEHEITLSACLDELTKTEQLSANDSWYCSKCQMHRQATKQLQLWSLPNILVLQLKRFAKRAKIDKLVTFPIHGLDFSERVGERGSKADYTYDLFAVDEHWGDRLSTGHYTAYAKNASDGAWYHYQDSDVSPTTPETAVNRGAYLLFYRRRSASLQDTLNKVKPRTG